MAAVSTHFERCVLGQIDSAAAILFAGGTPAASAASVGTDTPFMYFTAAQQRYQGLDLGYYKEMMTPYEFNAYLDFIGEDEMGFVPDDFEVYYPEDEE